MPRSLLALYRCTNTSPSFTCHKSTSSRDALCPIISLSALVDIPNPSTFLVIHIRANHQRVRTKGIRLQREGNTDIKHTLLTVQDITISAVSTGLLRPWSHMQFHQYRHSRCCHACRHRCRSSLFAPVFSSSTLLLPIRKKTNSPFRATRYTSPDAAHPCMPPDCAVERRRGRNASSSLDTLPVGSHWLL